ncbi:MAG: hypothetical protein WA555_05100 [Candidatus Sulfotelmatobacter sp.]
MPKDKMRGPISWVLLILLWLPAPSWAQAVGPCDQGAIARLTQQIKELQQQDSDLLKRIEILEGRQLPAASATEAASSLPPAPLEAAEQAPRPPAPSAIPHDWKELHGIQWRSFGEADYKVLNQRQPELGAYGFVPGSQGNFFTGDFGLFLTSRLTNKASVLSEIVFEEGDAQTYNVDLRRMLLRYDYNDRFKMSFGRYQTNIGYYNWAFRSAAWLQTTADRPLVMEYASNGGLLPTQAVGVSITGTIPSGNLGLNYVAEYGSSDTIRPDINGDGLLTDENNGNQTNVGIFAGPDELPGLQIGTSYYHDKISNNDIVALSGVQVRPVPGAPGFNARYGQTIVNGYVVYAAHGVELLNEGFLIRFAPLHFTYPTFNTPAFYSQFSKQIWHLRPFFRYQYVNASPNDLIYDDVGLRYGPSFGARYDLNDYIAFKAQLDNTVRRGEPDLNALHLQFAFTF